MRLGATPPHGASASEPGKAGRSRLTEGIPGGSGLAGGGASEGDVTPQLVRVSVPGNG